MRNSALRNPYRDATLPPAPLADHVAHDPAHALFAAEAGDAALEHERLADVRRKQRQRGFAAEPDEVEPVRADGKVGRAVFQAAGGRMLALDRKEGLAVADAAGFQPFQFLRKPDVEGYPFPRTDAQRRLEIRARIRLADVLVQRGAQRPERLLADIDARGLRVAAEFGDVLAARLQRLIDVDAFDGAGGAFQTVAVRDEEGWRDG